MESCASQSVFLLTGNMGIFATQQTGIIWNRCYKWNRLICPGGKTFAWTPPCSTLEVYYKTPIFSPVYIKEDVVESFMRKLSGSSNPGGTDSEALQGCLLKSREYTKILSTSVENFSNWIANGIPPWATYHAYISDRLIALYKQPGVHTFGVGETCRFFF